MNGNSNGLTHLKRMELEFKGVSYLFTINPEQYEIKIPSRVNPTYTKGGVFLDLFGEGLREISISGLTGFKSQTDDPEHGYKKFLELKKLIQDNFRNVEEGEPVTEFVMLYNHTDGEGYVTVPSRLTISRNVNQPLLYRYDLDFYVIRSANRARMDSSSQQIGNPMGTPKTGARTVEDRVIKEKEGTNNNFSNKNLENLKKELIEEKKNDN